MNFICVCIYIFGVIHTGRGKLPLSLMSETAAHLYAWIICLHIWALKHPQIHSYTYLHTNRHIHAPTHQHPLLHIYHAHILLYSYFIDQEKNYYLFVLLYNKVILIIWNFVLLI